ncbi:uncharacterized protein [Nyctibius grandis]|uniref:uncharacterized protein n=1 Tax=Nyctibius grandis TaxID=48427 RepID=UPI0035BBFCBF
MNSPHKAELVKVEAVESQCSTPQSNRDQPLLVISENSDTPPSGEPSECVTILEADENLRELINQYLIECSVMFTQEGPFSPEQDISSALCESTMLQAGKRQITSTKPLKKFVEATNSSVKPHCQKRKCSSDDGESPDQTQTSSDTQFSEATGNNFCLGFTATFPPIPVPADSSSHTASQSSTRSERSIKEIRRQPSDKPILWRGVGVRARKELQHTNMVL